MDMDRSGLLADEDANKGIKKPLFGWEGGGMKCGYAWHGPGKRGRRGGSGCLCVVGRRRGRVCL